MGDVFYFVGIGLTAVALLVSFVGLRSEQFPPNGRALAGLLGGVAAIVVATCAFAVVLSEDERDKRNAELAEAAEKPESKPTAAPVETTTSTTAEATTAGGPTGSSNGGGAGPLALSSPADGSLVFDPTALEAKAGEVEIDYTNPSPVSHSVAIDAPGGSAGDVVSGGEVSTATAKLDPGAYTFYCTVPGHREAGMEGTLTVK